MLVKFWLKMALLCAAAAAAWALPDSVKKDSATLEPPSVTQVG